MRLAGCHNPGMRQVLNDIEAGKLSDELERRGIPPGQRLRVVVTIVLTDFPFTDLTAAKRRPALVISTDDDRRTGGGGRLHHLGSALRPRYRSTPHRKRGLKVPSLVRFDKIATINRDIIAGRLGAADPAWLTASRAVFCGVSRLGS